MASACCRRAFDIDLVAFVHDARGPEWADFREHYPLCADCSVEVRTWTELEILLQGGAPPAITHPTADDLLSLDSRDSALDPGYRRIVEYHVASCRPCADEIATLRAFDFTDLDAAAAMHRAAIPAANGRAVSPIEPLDVAAEPATTTDAAVDSEPEIDMAAAEADIELGEEAALVDELEPAVAPCDVEPEAATLIANTASVADALTVELPTPEEDPTFVSTPSAGVAARLAHAIRHPAAGVLLVALLLLPALWLGDLPEFPFGAPTGLVPHELPEARVAVATVDLLPVPSFPQEAVEFPVPGLPPEAVEAEDAIAPSVIAEEELLPPEDEAVQVARARTDGDPLARAPGLVVSDELADAADAVDPWALARLDREAPLEIVAARLAAGIELEVPVPLSVPAGAVLQVQIRGDGAREIVERLSFPGVREISLRVPAAWLVPGKYQIEVGVVRRAPAPVRVASYALVVH